MSTNHNGIATGEKRRYVATCQAGLEKTLEKELRSLGCFTLRVENRLVFFQGDAAECARANLGCRVAQRVWLVAWEGECRDFDSLYEAVKGVEWERWIASADTPVNVDAHVESSVLASPPAIQRVTRKAIGDRLANAAGHRWNEPFSVLVLVLRDQAVVLLDTTGAPLHRRGYRETAGEAPIKETLAAGLIALSEWDRITPFVDPLCGSGTIAIEAAMIVSDIAPGLGRSFVFERFADYDSRVFADEMDRARSRIKTSDTFVYALDRDPDMARIASENAIRAGVNVVVRALPFPRSLAELPERIHLVTNPPYGERLDDPDVGAVNRALLDVLRSESVTGGFITAYPLSVDPRLWRDRKLKNGSITCRFYTKKKAG